MTVTNRGNGNYTALSTDTAPTTVDVNVTRYDTDTRMTRIHEGSNFWEYVNPNTNPIQFKRKYGMLTGIVATPLNPLGLPITAATTQGSAVGNFSQSMGRYLTHTTGTTAGNNSGGKTGTNLFQRFHNPYFSWRGRTITTKTTGTLSSRFYIGMTSDASNDPTNVDTLNDAKSCFLFGYRSTDANYQIIRNDGSTPATYVDTGIVIDTAVRTVELFGDDANARFGYRINGGTITWYTTAIPAQTTWMGAYWMMTTTDTVAKAFDNIAIYTEFDSM